MPGERDFPILVSITLAWTQDVAWRESVGVLASPVPEPPSGVTGRAADIAGHAGLALRRATSLALARGRRDARPKPLVLLLC
jgi:hypothetical protein